ncbi:PadR family transcriptional regulator [Crossiella cryophila]|uniref:DNA-binding PadR family transcriptional regulator n=1 Tax=Crossiella cryophila TaxID=43355 RepID=A0A7W7CE97_9PSEU|nr:PadR family transcriptional regulator [Crossiella cryophila]MBB4679556.1 DNA-binding PadR family transcriptional regulator [Crossiella cryophila]
MSIQHVLLGVLEARPMSGYELTQLFSASTRWVWSAPQSQIYPALKTMEAAGLITGEQLQTGGRVRTVYSITEPGLAELRQWIGTAHPSPPSRDALDVQALYFDLVEPAVAKRVLTEFIAEQQAAAEHATAHSARLLAKDTELLRERLSHRPAAEHDRMARLKAHVFAGQAAVAEARIAWAREGLRLLDEA